VLTSCVGKTCLKSARHGPHWTLGCNHGDGVPRLLQNGDQLWWFGGQAHSQLRFPEPSSKLYQNCWRRYLRSAVHRRHQRPPKGLATNKTVEATQRPSTYVNMRRVCPGYKKRFHLDSNDFGFICADVSNVGGYKRSAWCNLSCLLQTYCHLNTNEKLSVSWQFLETGGVISYGSGWR